MKIKFFIFTLLLIFSCDAYAQKLKKIFVNLYTDSLKKGTYNYINVDGQLENGQYTPLDSSAISFWSSDGKFTGNELFIERDFKKDKVLIKISTKTQPAINKEFFMYVKKLPDGPVKTSEELFAEMNQQKIKKKTRAKKDSLPR